MEYVGAVSEGEWSSLSGMYTAEEEDFMARLLEKCPLSSMPGMAFPDAFWQGNEESTMHMSGNYEGSHGSLETTNSNFIASSNGSYYESDSQRMLATNNDHSSMSIDFGVGDMKTINTYLVEGNEHDQCSNQETSKGNIEESGGSRPEALNLEKVRRSQSSLPKVNSMKRSQSSDDVQLNKRSMKAKKSLRISTSNIQDSNTGPNRQSSSSCCSEDDSIVCKEVSGGISPTSSLSTKDAAAPDLNGKSRARRGSASDPQSLYARKRREKINERLKVLQNLVPNGTKVDISTMLEEAVHYVKFLQLQIKLLSSDDMWMYAPICYNGMDLGLDRKLTTPSQP